jgi:hypothetical protein
MEKAKTSILLDVDVPIWPTLAMSVLLLVLSGCGGVEREFNTLRSPGGEFELVVTVTEPALPHARHRVAIYLQENGSTSRSKLLETRLANDGVPFTDRNIGVRWTSPTSALVCLRPTDLPDRGIRIRTAEPPTATIKMGC